MCFANGRQANVLSMHAHFLQKSFSAMLALRISFATSQRESGFISDAELISALGKVLKAPKHAAAQALDIEGVLPALEWLHAVVSRAHLIREKHYTPKHAAS